MSKLLSYRKLFQTVSLLISFYFLINLISNNFIVAHQFCPFSSICFGVAELNPVFKYSLFIVPVIIGIGIVFIGIFTGRAFCGFICPIGTWQEFTNKLATDNLKIKQIKIPSKTHKTMSLLKYAILLFTIVSAYFLRQYLYVNLCPVMSVSRLEFVSIGGVIILSTIVILPLFVKRFWCNYICPYAALMNIFIFIGQILHIPRAKITRDKSICINCKICSSKCPMNIQIDNSTIIYDPNCIYCGECISACPVNEGLKFKR